MKKILTIIPIAILTLILFGTEALADHPSSSQAHATGNGTVYICTSPSAYAYHRSRGCPLLNRCNYTIKSVSVSTAKSMKRKPCSKCG